METFALKGYLFIMIFYSTADIFSLLQKVFFKYAIIQNNKKIKTGKNLYLIWFKANELSYKEYKLAERKLNI